MSKSYWLLKSEPDVWSIEKQRKVGSKGAPTKANFTRSAKTAKKKK